MARCPKRFFITGCWCTCLTAVSGGWHFLFLLLTSTITCVKSVNEIWGNDLCLTNITPISPVSHRWKMTRLPRVLSQTSTCARGSTSFRLPAWCCAISTRLSAHWAQSATHIDFIFPQFVCVSRLLIAAECSSVCFQTLARGQVCLTFGLTNSARKQWNNPVYFDAL